MQVQETECRRPGLHNEYLRHLIHWFLSRHVSSRSVLFLETLPYPMVLLHVWRSCFAFFSLLGRLGQTGVTCGSTRAGRCTYLNRSLTAKCFTATSGTPMDPLPPTCMPFCLVF